MVVSNLVLWAADVIALAIQAYILVVIVRALISWVSPDPYNPIVRFLNRVTEPVLRPIRRRLPDLGGIDISPMLLILVLWFVNAVVVSSLRDLALGLR